MTAPDQTTVERFHGLQTPDSVEMLLHLHRYQLATGFADGGNVLDFGTGDGYGAHLLSYVAETVLAVDYDLAAIASAQDRYSRANLRYEQASPTALSRLPSGSFSLITCFEVIEHIVESDQEILVNELARLLSPDGTLLLSTPNKAVKIRQYERFPDWVNPYHLRELTDVELVTLLKKQFHMVELWPQVVELASVVDAGSLVNRRVTFPSDCAWVNIVRAGHTPPSKSFTYSPICLPRKMRLIEDILASNAGVRKDRDDFSRQLAKTEAKNARAAERNRLALRTQARLTAERDRATKECFDAQIRIRDLENETQRMNEEYEKLKATFSVRLSHVFDRWPAAKRLLSKAGATVFRR